MKLVIGHKGKSYKKEIEDLSSVLNKKIGDKISGDSFGLSGYELQITGGSDKQGFPMRSSVHGIRRIKPIISAGVGIRKKNIKKRKTVRGNTVSEEISQLNLKVIKEGSQPLDKIFGPAEEPKKEEKKELKEEKSEST